MSEAKKEETKQAEAEPLGEAVSEEKVEEDSVETILLKKRIKAAFELFDKEGKGSIMQEDVGTVMRYLGHFPSDDVLQANILPSLQVDDTSMYIYYEKFEKRMLEYFTTNELHPDGEEVLMAAFQALDEEKNGYIEEEYLKAALCQMGNKFSSKEYEAFITAAKDVETGKIYYEDYISTFSSQMNSMF